MIKKNILLQKIFLKKIFKIIKNLNLIYYRFFIWIYIIILIFILINKKIKLYNTLIFNKYKYLLNFLFILLLLNKCQKSDLN
nr:hypothetical protein [Plasmodium chiricahuae]